MHLKIKPLDKINHHKILNYRIHHYFCNLKIWTYLYKAKVITWAISKVIIKATNQMKVFNKM
jgi:hypothetical protein